MVGLERAAAWRGAAGVREFLAHMEALAAQVPCLVLKADMFRLLDLAGFDRADLAWRQIEESGSLVLVLPDGLLQLVAMVRDGQTAGQ